MLKAIAQTPRSVRIAAGAGIAWAVGLGVVRFVSTERPVHRAEWWIGDLALAATLAAPGIIAFVSRGARAWLIAAAVLSIAVAPVSLTGLALPLVIPGAVYLAAAARAERSPRPASAVGAVVVAAALVLAFALALFAPHRVVCWQSAGSSGCTDGASVPAASIASIALVVVASAYASRSSSHEAGA